MKIFDRMRVVCETTGQGTITLGAAVSPNFFTLEEAGAVDGDETFFVIEEAGNIEICTGIVGSSATTLTRATVHRSKIAGIVGTDKIELGGDAVVYCVDPALWLNDIEARAGLLKVLTETIKTDSYNVTDDDSGGLLTANKGTSMTYTLPAVNGSKRNVHFFRNIGLGDMVIDGNGAETVEGTTTRTYKIGESCMVYKNAGKTAWRVFDFHRIPTDVPDTMTFSDPASPTKKARIDAGSVTGGQTRVLNMPDRDVTLKAPTSQAFAASGTWNRPAGCTSVIIVAVGGGGGGGGADGQSPGQAAAGGGGGSGAWGMSSVVSVLSIASSTITIGTGGGGGIGTGGNGSTGGDTIWSDGTNTLTWGGGAGGAGRTAVNAWSAAAGGAGGVGTNVIAAGAPGLKSMYAGTAGPVAMGGEGGSNPWGAGAAAPSTVNNGSGNGNAGSGRGSGGSGAVTANVAGNGTGGAGTDGYMIVYEFYG
ncbi:MAG TPA: hypothetical protein VMF90_03120 [Rhizobiaceae bacterium]|nr:hypothetical protein [Rhizobiaceae bacterium]